MSPLQIWASMLSPTFHPTDESLVCATQQTYACFITTPSNVDTQKKKKTNKKTAQIEAIEIRFVPIYALKWHLKITQVIIW